MLEKILRLRFVFVIAVAVTFVNSLFFIFLGVRNAWHGYVLVIKGTPQHESNPGLYFVESLDMFMIGLVFLTFSLGMMRIFTHYHSKGNNLPEWLQITSFKELKILLWEAILVTLVIGSVSILVRRMSNISWEVLIVPGMILILSLSLYLMRKEEDKH